jgi:hypothetical protein
MSRRPPESARSASLLAGDRGIWVLAGLVVIAAASATSLATLATQMAQGLSAAKTKTVVVQTLARPAPAAPANTSQ